MKVSEILHRTCDNCRFSKKEPFDVPCSYCENYSNWTSLYSKESKIAEETKKENSVKTCDNCRFSNKSSDSYPCCYCKDYSNWISLSFEEYDEIESEPEPGEDGQVVLYQVLKDLIDRAEVGKKEYGTYLKTNNGRSALKDAYEEALDLCMYLKQTLLESQK